MTDTMPEKKAGFLDLAAWGLALILIGVAAVLWQGRSVVSLQRKTAVPRQNTKSGQSSQRRDFIQRVPLKSFPETITGDRVTRNTIPDTIIPNQARLDVITYTVVSNDSVFAIAKKFNLKPESVLWANYDKLKDNPHAIAVGMKLKIPPTDGVLYQWKEGDTLDKVAVDFDVSDDAILGWVGNKVDLTDPHFDEGSLVMVPGGHREFQQWLIPTIPRGHAGVSAGLYGSGACSGSFQGAVGTGAFMWPTTNHTISGNDYWSGHLAIDIGSASGSPVVAADSGVVVFAGWANGGYGNMVMIDHGNGYQTLYAHLNSILARCGQSVTKGQMIARSGSTGNSTGPHLHFEIRYQGGFINPWYVLPAP